MNFKKLIICLLLIAVLFCGCGKEKIEEPVNSTTTTQAETTEVSIAPQETTKKPVAQTTKATETTSQSGMQKKGDMIFTDSADDKFISAISQKYKVDTSLLACLYTTTDEPRNYVWQFKNTTDDKGRIIKTDETLEYVYIVSQDCQTIQRTGGLTGNIGLNPVAGYIAFEGQRQLFIPQYQQQLYS